MTNNNCLLFMFATVAVYIKNVLNTDLFLLLLYYINTVFKEKNIEYFLPGITSDPQTTQKTRGDQDQHRLTKIEKARPRCLSTGKTVNATSRKDCRNCYKNKKRVNTTTECKNVQVLPHYVLTVFLNCMIALLNNFIFSTPLYFLNMWVIYNLE